MDRHAPEHAGRHTGGACKHPTPPEAAPPRPAEEHPRKHTHGRHADHDGHTHGGHGPHHHAGHGKHAGHSVEMFRRKFWATLALTIPTLIWSEQFQEWFGYNAPVFAGSAYVADVFGVVVYFYGGWVFLQGMSRELRDRLPGMMTLISLAITVAFVYSLAVTLGYPGMALWWELSTLVAIMLLGHRSEEHTSELQSHC